MVLFFVKLYAVLSPKLIEADTDLVARRSIVLEPGIDKNRLKQILASENYFPDPRDLQLVTDFPGSILVNEARQRYRALRGDNLN